MTQACVADLGIECDPGDRDVLGEQPQPRIAQRRLDTRRPASDLGLLAERGELPAEFTGEVVEPGQAGLHRLELAERLLLALAVLEHPGGLFDEPAALLGTGVQHGVELALPDDDVQLAADAGV